MKSVVAAVGKLPIADVMKAVLEIVELQKIVAVQETERLKIIAQRDVAIAAIARDRDCLSAYFRDRFAERRTTIEECFALLSEGLEAKNDKVIDESLHLLLTTVGSNPLDDFEAFKRMRESGEMLEI